MKTTLSMLETLVTLFANTKPGLISCLELNLSMVCSFYSYTSVFLGFVHVHTLMPSFVRRQT